MSSEVDTAVQKISKGAGIVFFGTMLQLGLAFFAKTILARFLEVPQYGLISLGILVLNICATLSLLGLDSGVARFLPRYDVKTERIRVVRLAYLLVLPISIVFSIVVFSFSNEISQLFLGDHSLSLVLQIMAIGIPFWSLLDLGVGITRGAEQAYPRVVSKNVLLPGSRFILIAIVAITGFGIAGMSVAYVAGYGIAAVSISIYLLYYSDIISVRVKAVFLTLSEISSNDIRMSRKLLVFSIPLLFSGVSSFLINNVDLVLLGALTNASQVGIYNVAYPLASILTTVPGALGFLFLPVVSDLHANDKLVETKRIYQLTSKWLFLATAPLFVVMALAPNLLIKLLFGSAYTAGSSTLVILALGFLFHSLMGLNDGCLTSFGHSRIVMYGQLVSLGVNIGLNLLLIPEYGFLGAAIATTISFVILNAFYSVVLFYSAGIQPFSSSLLQPAIFIIITTSVIYLYTLTITVTFPVLVILFALFLLLTTIIVLRFGGIDKEDVMLFNAVEAKVGIDLSAVKFVLKSVMK